MATAEPRLPEPFAPAKLHVGDFHVNELAADQAGSLSPFGPEMVFPLPLSKLPYRHPEKAHRPHLADGR
jgi:hypothetical protein